MSSSAPVYNISPQRSGTKSFHALCLAHGATSVHYTTAREDDLAKYATRGLDTALLWELYRPYFGAGDTFSDFPMPLVYREAFQERPDAKFVLILRPVEDWVRSVRTLTAGRDLSWLERFFYHQSAFPSFGGRGLEPYTDDDLTAAYLGFSATATTYLRSRGANLLVAPLGAPYLARDLGEYLGFEVHTPMEHLV